jgi:hypothetical protein
MVQSINDGRFESGSEWFFIPNFARNWMLDEDSAITLTLAGNGGMNTDYDVGYLRKFHRARMHPSSSGQPPPPAST